MRVITRVVVLLGWVMVAWAADNGEARTPPMGWNSWYALGCDALNQTAVQETASIMASEWNGKPSLMSYGYQFLVLDDCWAAYERDYNGNIIADPEKFPDGMESLSEFVREFGLDMGLYTTPGNITCEGRTATGGHEVQDVNQFVNNWAMTYLKYCMCNTTHEWRLEAYGIFYDAVNATGIPVTVENDPPEHPWTWLAPDANLWGIYDIEDNFDSWVAIVNSLQDRGEAPYAAPGHWNMPDMIQIGNGGQTQEEYKAQMSMYSLLATPLFIGTDLRTMTQDTYDILTNQGVIDANQDSLGVQGQRMTPAENLSQVWSKPLEDGSFAVVMINANVEGEDTLSISWEELSQFWDGFEFEYGDSYTTSDAIRPYYKDVEHSPKKIESLSIEITDIWSGDVLATFNSTSSQFSMEIPAHISQMVKFTMVDISANEDTDSYLIPEQLWLIILGIAAVLITIVLAIIGVFLYQKMKKKNKGFEIETEFDEFDDFE